MNLDPHTTHPAALPTDVLREGCVCETLTRSGPGGQHRNRVQTGIRIRHIDTDLRAEAFEHRSQKRNMENAVFRLRLKMALEIRRTIGPDTAPDPRWRQHSRARQIQLSETHDDYPALLADALDHLEASGFAAAETAERLGISTSQLIRLIKKTPAAFERLNRRRMESGLPPLK